MKAPNISKILPVFRFVFFFTFFASRLFSQTCGGTFGNPIFNETFGSVTNSAQTVSAPLSPPAFTTYSYAPVFPPNDGSYTISNSTEYLSWGWSKSNDHTNDPTGTYGNMLVVNASFSAGEFYRRRVSNLCSNQIYRFSAWILNIHRQGANLIKPNVTLQIRSVSGAILGTVNTGNLAEENGEVWRNFYLDFKSDPNSTDVDVVMINNASGGNGNDLAIDDITFSPCGPATTTTSNIGVITSGVCDNSQSFQLNANLSSNTFLNVNYIWQKSSDGGITWNSITLPSNNPVVKVAAGSYKNNDQFRFIVGEAANILSTNCQVISAPVSLKVHGYPNAPVVDSPLNLCQNSIAQPLSATGSNLIWYTAAFGGTGNTVAPKPDTSIIGSSSYWVSQNVNGCESARSEIKVNISAVPAAPNVSDITLCMNTTANPLTAQGNNLLWYSDAIGGTGNPIAPVPDTSKAGIYNFWVSSTSSSCESARSLIKVEILQAPFSSTVKDESICDGGSVILDAGFGFDGYEWNTNPPTFTQTLKVSTIGNYSVTITDKNGCKTTQTAKVTAGTPPKIDQIISKDNSLEILASSGTPPYLYSIDNQQTWQESNIFTNLKAGVYTVYVKSKLTSCMISVKTAIIFIPNIITPNGDSLNELFNIQNLEYFPNSKIIIFDRFGKLIFTAHELNKLSWNGLQSGRNLPSGTYWFVIDLGNGYQKSGWVLVKGR